MAPKTEDTVKIAKFLNTTAEYLVTGEEPEIPFLSEKEKKLFDLTRNMTDNEIDKLIGIAEVLAPVSQKTEKLSAG